MKKNEKAPEYITDLPNGDKEITISNGIKIKMREPKVKDGMMVSHESDELKREIALIGNLCVMTSDDVADLTLKDFSKVQEALKSFL